MIDIGIFEHISEYVTSLVEIGERIDGRKFDEYRKINIIKGYVKNAEGSCYVELGNTKVLAGVKIEVGEPFPETPDEGVFIVNLEILPSAFPTIEAGPPGPDAIEYARIIDRTIRSSGFIRTKDLVIEKGKYVWTIFIDIYVLNDDGNIVDASMLATIGALLDSKLPKLEKTENGYKINQKEKTNPLPLNLNKLPLVITFAKIKDKFLLDPNKYEEESANMIIHFGISGNKINSIQTRGSSNIKIEEINELISKALEQYNKLKNEGISKRII